MTPEIINMAEERLADLLTFFEVNPSVRSEFDGETLHLQVAADTTGRLIGRRGETLQALQHLLNMMVRRETNERLYIQIDVGGYKQARLERLLERARELAEKVAAEGGEAELPHLTPAERRHIHALFTDHGQVQTESRGEGNRRRLVIKKRD